MIHLHNTKQFTLCFIFLYFNSTPDYFETVPESDFYYVVKSLDPDELQLLFSALGISNSDIRKAEAKENTTDVNRKGEAVLRFWKQEVGNKATWSTLLGAFDRNNFNSAKENLADFLKQKYSGNSLGNHLID